VGTPGREFAVRNFRVWWALFVFFGVLSVLALQQGYRRWRRAWNALAAAPGPGRDERQRRLRREGIRLACMAASVITMTALVFAALLRAPAAVLIGLRLLAVAGVAGVVWLSVRR
jgi:3-mercaptopyruvate sulfurtransferase SseA